ncbi:MAG: hypothetical protein FJ100_00885 [Deltaproteobacteria bacterium]|nr:hypothetical protein [Deltaproteobacteria bacterium]
MINPMPMARCAACVANETPYGWWILSAVVLVTSLCAAGFVIWRDLRKQNQWRQVD